MTTVELLATKGIENVGVHYPAENGEHRCGVIRKEMRIWSPSDWSTSDAVYSTVGIIIDTWEKTIEVIPLIGSMPYVTNLICALLADRDIRRLIIEYQNGEEKTEPFEIWSKVGMSGSEDVFKTTAYTQSGFAVSKTKKICHISCYGRLNEGFGDRKSGMKISDFVELCVFLGLTDDMNVRSLRKKARVKYIVPRFAEEIAHFRTSRSKIL